MIGPWLGKREHFEERICGGVILRTSGAGDWEAV